MKSLVQQVGIYLWIFYFLVSMTGVNLQSLYCYCTDEGYISLFAIEHQCEEHQEIAKKPTCCKVGKQCSFMQQEGDCCPPVEQFIKADIDLSWVSLDFPTFSITGLAVSKNHWQTIFPTSIFENALPNYRPPPKRHGVELRHFMQSYLC